MLRKYATNEQMVRRKAVQQQNTTQQTQAQTQVQAAPPSRGPFPWLRLLCAGCIGLLLIVLSMLLLLSTGRVISSIWVYIAPIFIGLVFAIFPVLQYFFPLNPVTLRAGNAGQTSSPAPIPSPVPPVLPASPTAQPQGTSASSSPSPMAPTAQPAPTTP